MFNTKQLCTRPLLTKLDIVVQLTARKIMHAHVRPGRDWPPSLYSPYIFNCTTLINNVHIKFINCEEIFLKT